MIADPPVRPARRGAAVFASLGGVATVVLSVATVALTEFTRLGSALTVPLLALTVTAALTVVAIQLLAYRDSRRVVEANGALELHVQQRTEELEDTQLEVVRRLAAAVESRDVETGSHIERISCLSERLALAIGMSPDEARMIRHASALHDIGKIAIPDPILLKPGKLDAAEWELMKTHASVGADILAASRSPLLQLAEVIARAHHERWDGAGYPAGLTGEAIPLIARVCAICDTYDALLSKRPYKAATTREAAMAEITRCSGTQFDPRLVEAFLSMLAEVAEVAEAPAASRPVDTALAGWALTPEAITQALPQL